jgi:spore germination protein KA
LQILVFEGSDKLEIGKLVKKIFIFSELPEKNVFELDENSEKENTGNKNDSESKVEESKKSNNNTIEPKNSGLKNFILPKKLDNLDKLENKDKLDSKEEIINNGMISKKLSENLKVLTDIYTLPINSDVMLREFKIVIKDKTIPAFIIFIDGMTDKKVIDDDILAPFMLLSNLETKGNVDNIDLYIRNHLLLHNQIKEVKTHEKVVSEVNFGGCGIYVDGIEVAFTADVKGWEHRGVEKPTSEIIIRGPQEGFNEIIRVNSALIRRRIIDENLIVESVEIGKKSKTPCSILYIKNIANNKLVEEVRKRLNGINVDYIFDSGELEQYIEDSSINLSPQILATERPDRVSAMLSEGRVAIILSGSPFVLVVPIVFSDLMSSPEDSYIRFPFANLLRIIRYLGGFAALLLPGLYIAITNFHQEMIPTDLLFAIEAAREKVPFPSVIEILMMEISFELIREAGIRVPGPIGPTLGIIGALILGQAAVAANIVSPILIIIVAVTGIGSFAIPNFSLGFSFRMLRFVYIFLGAIAGLLGITVGVFLHLLSLVSVKSFGVPFTSPFAPVIGFNRVRKFFKPPIWMMEKRPDYLNVHEKNSQGKISRVWRYSKNEK